MAEPKFDRLIRFVDESGRIHFGELPKDHAWDKDLHGIEVAIYSGETPFDENLKLTGQKAVVKKVLCPLADVPFIYGVGLNYKRHAAESGHALPSYPRTFVKYPGKQLRRKLLDFPQGAMLTMHKDALTGPYEDVHIHPAAKDVDYEGELVFIVGKTVKNVPSKINALDNVFAYTVGNDLSSRFWQDEKRGGNQSHYAKSFDQFAPLGPVLVSSRMIPDPSQLVLRTFVNGEKRQESGVDDLIFNVSDIISYLSQGRTLRRGAVVMTGTPSGVGSFLPGGPRFLEDGDVVEIEIEGIGKIKNKFVVDS
ncbi:fumarylacetoacetate hydrolase family protein [Niveomyces insectorum RCEF 264]|uniref:Fumarylacetoacetate hydrolase family protein n=1 Tax=Niveomyces insectorum RCEF 264 TaxID=1081102 RepID=A0A167Y034_9HYPO|nr:fumarylacetoacetate hydrolase family protein [Niveomyces insectorum RCEF 264]